MHVNETSKLLRLKILVSSIIIRKMRLLQEQHYPVLETERISS